MTDKGRNGPGPRGLHAAESDPVVLVALEHGSEWPVWARGQTSGTVVLAQQPAEDALTFARRVVHRISNLGAGKRLRNAVIAVAPDVGKESFQARCRMIQAALRAMPDEVDTNVMLSADDTVDEVVRHELFALVGALHEHLRSCSVGIRFGRPVDRLRRCVPGDAVAMPA